jgi:hypothetical protein
VAPLGDAPSGRHGPKQKKQGLEAAIDES